MLKPPNFQTEAEVQDYLWGCVHIEPLSMQDEYVRLPSDMAYWNERYSTAYGRWLELKAKKDRVYARVFHEVTFTAEVDGKKLAIAAADLVVQRSEDYQQVVTAIAAAEAEKVRFSGVLDAIRAKRDMLIGLGAHVRAEMHMSGQYGEKGGDR